MTPSTEAAVPVAPTVTGLEVLDAVSVSGVAWEGEPADTGAATSGLLGDEGVVSSATNRTLNELDVFARVYVDATKRAEQTAILRDLRAQTPFAAEYVECGPIAVEVIYIGPASPDRAAAVQELAQQTSGSITSTYPPC